ncbi:hypothetical protein WICPIJ_000214 [Wickerhamomyces pijperi]|uniref:Uncharacterized protein n=1 Tax=Wickerhamomyces pijperi TaxID=599730 RepID=A0A9P8QD20_WICPI|nr:hypothetical protein WICPIJ_000214 [Wickerhamomyces pijperi]
MLFKKSVLTAIASLLVSANADSLQVPITYEKTINMNYFFKDNDGTATINNNGIVVTANQGQDLLTVLSGAEIVYSVDTSSEKVLLAADCYDVYNLVDSEGNAITWDRCEEYSDINALIASSSSAYAATHSSSSTAAASAASGVSSVVATSSSAAASSSSIGETQTASSSSSSAGAEAQTASSSSAGAEAQTASSSAGAEAQSSLVLPTSYTVVTTTVDNVETIYTTTCPLTYTTTVITTTSNGVVTSYTTYCPLTASTADMELTSAITTVNAYGNQVVYSSTVKTNFIADSPESVNVPLPTNVAALSSISAKAKATGTATVAAAASTEDDSTTYITRYQVTTTTEGDVTKTLTVPTVLTTTLPKASTTTTAAASAATTTKAGSGATVVEQQSSSSSSSSSTSVEVQEYPGSANRLSTGVVVGLVAGAIGLLF